MLHILEVNFGPKGRDQAESYLRWLWTHQNDSSWEEVEVAPRLPANEVSILSPTAGPVAQALEHITGAYSPRVKFRAQYIVKVANEEADPVL